MSSEECSSNSTGKRVKAKFRLNAKRLFLTYPQCPVPLEVFEEHLRVLFGVRLKWAIACIEKHHATSGKHIHCVLELTQKCNIRDPHRLDIILSTGKYHGKYESCRKLHDAIKYVCKDQEEVVGINCDWKVMLQAALEKTSTTGAIVATKIMDGESIHDINELYPQYVLQNLRKILEYQRFWSTAEMMKRPLKKFSGVQPVDKTSLAQTKIAKWINKNLLDLPTRKHKQKQLWIFGPTNSGKTGLLMTLNEFFHMYEIPDDNKWYDAYNDDFQVCFLDEYKGSKTIQWLNSFSEGRWMSLPQRGKQPYVKKKNVALIVASNFSIRSCYHNADEIVIEALLQRFEEVELSSFCELRFLSENPDSDEDTLDISTSSDEEGDAEMEEIVITHLTTISDIEKE